MDNLKEKLIMDNRLGDVNVDKSLKTLTVKGTMQRDKNEFCNFEAEVGKRTCVSTILISLKTWIFTIYETNLNI